jgi:uncharacterized protein (DUF58 family)
LPCLITGMTMLRLGQNRIYILPTKTGLGFCALLLIMLLVSINYNNPPGYLLTFLLTGLALVGIFHTHRGIAGLHVSHGQAPPVFAGCRACFPVIVRNPTRTHRLALQAGWSRLQAEDVQDIAPEAETLFTLTRPTSRRGMLHPGRVVVSTVYPLGLFRAWSNLALPLSCIVYPAPETGPVVLPLPDPVPEQAEGVDVHGFGDDEFEGLRGFQQGDPLRRVAWKAVAKSGIMMSKEFSAAHAAAHIWLDWDQVGLAEEEDKLARLCRWVLEAEERGMAYGLRLPNQDIVPGWGDAHKHACLSALALWGGAEKAQKRP